MSDLLKDVEKENGLEGLEIVKDYYKEIIDKDGNKQQIKIIIYKEIERRNFYTDSQKKSIQKYYEKNKDKIYEYQTNFIKNKKENDPEYYEKLKEQKRQSYYRLKEKKKQQNKENKNIQ